MATVERKASRGPSQTEEAAAASPRRRRRSVRLWIALGLLAAVVWFLPNIVAHTPLLSWGLKVATADLNGSVSIRSASLGWLSPIEARGVEMKDAQDRNVLEADSVQCDRTLLGLICNMTNFGRVTVENPKLSVVLRDDGSNLEDMLAKYLAPRPEPEKPASKFAFALKINNGSISVTDQRTSQGWQVQKFGFGFEMLDGADGPMGVELLAELADARRPGSLKATLKMAPDGNKAAVAVSGLPLGLLRAIVWRLSPGTVLDGRLSTNVAITWNTAGQKTVNVDLDGEALSLTAPALQTDLVRLNRLHASCLAAWQGEEVQIEKSAIDCDVGSASVASTLRLRGVSFDSLLTDRHDIKGHLDLAALSRMLPATLRIKRDVSVNSGQVAFTFQSVAPASAGPGKTETNMQWHGQLDLANLAATAGGRQIAWKPMSLAFDAKRGPDRLLNGSLKCESDFLKIHANGNADALVGSFSFNLKQLGDELSQFVDLGTLQLGGVGWGNMSWQRSPDQKFRADGDVHLQNFELGVPSRPVWREDDLLVSLSASGQTDLGENTRVDAAAVSVNSATDKIGVRLLQPVNSLRDGGTWPVRLEAKGKLDRWPGRLAAWLPSKNCQFMGDYSVDVAAVASKQTIDMRQVKITAAPLVVASPWVNINEPQFALDAVGTWNQAQRRLQVEPATLTCATIGVQANNVNVALPEKGPMEVAGTLAYQGDVGRLRQWLCGPVSGPTWQIAGQLRGGIRAQSAQGVIQAETTTDISNLAVVDRNGQQFQEPLMRLVARGNYTNSSGVLQLDQCELTSDAVAVGAKGRMSPVSGRQNADLSAQLQYDFERLCGLTRPWIGPNVHIAGRGRSEASFRGPFDLRTGSGAASLRWDAASLYGMRLGPGVLKAKLSDGIAEIEPLDMAVNQGRVHLAPKVQVGSSPMLFTMPQGPVVQKVQIDPAMCGSMLKFIAPVLEGVTTAKGSFSIDLDGCRIPISDPGKGEVAGRFTIHSVEIGPGPLIHELSTFMGRDVPAKLKQESVVQFRMVDRRVWHQGLELMFPDFTIRTYGSVGLDETLKIMAEMPVPPKLLQNNPLVSQAMRNEIIKLPIAGTLRKPQLDKQVMADLSRRFLQRAATNVLQGELNKQLDRFLGPKK